MIYLSVFMIFACIFLIIKKVTFLILRLSYIRPSAWLVKEAPTFPIHVVANDWSGTCSLVARNFGVAQGHGQGASSIASIQPATSCCASTPHHRQRPFGIVAHFELRPLI